MIDFLENDCILNPEKTAFVFLNPEKNTQSALTYSDLAGLVEQLAFLFIKQGFTRLKALLIYSDSRDFIIAFLACQYAGMVPVPVLYSRGRRQSNKIINIYRDSGAEVILTSSGLKHFINSGAELSEPELHEKLFCTDIRFTENIPATFSGRCDQSISFLQYTSGSTGNAKGVMVSQKNLLHNHRLIQTSLSTCVDSVIFSWLPFQHDMGLVGNILHNIFIGGTCVLMPSYYFIQHPLSWLSGITDYKATHSGAPNFAFDLCINRIAKEDIALLDLAGWKVAFNGSEPVRYNTIKRFSEYFASAGFNAGAFYPCYGMAEATLFVSGFKNGNTPSVAHRHQDGAIIPGFDTNKINPTNLISSGSVPPGMDVLIITGDKICREMEEGEILISGESVTEGYWNKNNTRLFRQVNGKNFLQTGDLGFLNNGDLFISGRIKELLIIRGRNFYPNDIETKITEAENNIVNNGVVVFGTGGGEESFVVVAEIKRNALNAMVYPNIILSVNNVVSDTFGIVPMDIVLVPAFGVPRTTSGKLMRLECRKMYENNELNVVESKLNISPLNKRIKKNNSILVAASLGGDSNALKEYLNQIIQHKAGITMFESLKSDTTLTEAGLDSLRMMELINTVNSDFDINLDTPSILRNNTFLDLVNMVENMIWVKTAPRTGKEVII